MSNTKVKLTLIKSPIGRLPKHRMIVKQLGLRKLNHSVVHNNTPEIFGLINIVHYLLNVEECV